MAESRKCEHGQIRLSCRECYVSELEKICSDRGQTLLEMLNRIQQLSDDLVLNEVQYRIIIDRLQDRIDTIHAQHRKTFCQVVKRLLKRYTQAALKISRSLTQALSKKFKEFNHGDPT